MQARLSKRGPIALVAAAVAVCACADVTPPPPAIRPLAGAALTAPPPPFQPEPGARETFTGTRPFEAGARLRIVSFSLSDRVVPT